MNKKYSIIIITGMFLIISGICYSCAFHKKNSPEFSQTQLDRLNSDTQSGDNLGAGKSDLAGDNNSDDKSSKQHSSTPDNTKEEGLTQIPKPGESEKTDIYIHICGAVLNPGVYKAGVGARIFDLINMSGGLTEEAAGDFINQAMAVSDGQRIYIPTKKEVENLTPAEYLEEESTLENIGEKSDLININTADTEALMKLPGIGKAKAASIIEYRTANGSFQTIEELMKISGIKEGLFNRIAPCITVN